MCLPGTLTTSLWPLTLCTLQREVVVPCQSITSCNSCAIPFATQVVEEHADSFAMKVSHIQQEEKKSVVL